MSPSCALLGEFAICARVSLLWQHYGNAWQTPAVIRQAYRMLHMHTTHAGEDSPRRQEHRCACCVHHSISSILCGGVITRTQNVGEYMLVLAVCLVSCISCVLRLVLCIISIGFIIGTWCNYIVDCVGFVLSVCCCIGISLAHYNKSRAPAFGALTLFVSIKRISDT